ncbi:MULTISPECIES: hypothetical protein [Methylobacterium]|jgi:hypothetical protein|uniref:Uncharacterized protein n=1 Tax=Methylobacterium jeotgali TaxID=381630 RepID=A0ABQ4T292_9HYPH|nr:MULTISPECIES: hypothetical protein [Methylobacterium]PIU05253.1 MAG: hypothetical protein COT56_15810 [Methylobacterium sp. CG09_land_8_20_14_0_10_71_15]PIU11996.1 MAG: hypothetical protein COT28_17145 [Methylobacterium sp. CG08_land_8_20_14_0_20_71_15]GBU16813.1 hypothetical protein AwMethylo_10280 [Methylobacterium sp.]GJE08360.1 hypothetical protein AOPFMNJM_3697 [Methylobacterium jeotgali]
MTTLPAFNVQYQTDVFAANAYAAAGQALAALREAPKFVVNGEEIDLSSDSGFTPRSLRPDSKYQTRSGRPVDILKFDDGSGSEFCLHVRIHAEDGSFITGARTKAGRHPASKGDHPGDVVEVNPTVTRWLRIYDRKLNEEGKQVVGGKEYPAERGLFLYMFDTEAEARANLRGVRAVVPVEYREGEGLG